MKGADRQKRPAKNNVPLEIKAKIVDADADSAVAAAATAMYTARFGVDSVNSRLLATIVLPFSAMPELCSPDKVVSFAAGACAVPTLDAKITNLVTALQLRPSVSHRLMGVLNCGKLTVKPLRQAAAQDIQRWKNLTSSGATQDDDDDAIAAAAAALSPSHAADVSIVSQALRQFFDVIYTKRYSFSYFASSSFIIAQNVSLFSSPPPYQRLHSRSSPHSRGLCTHCEHSHFCPPCRYAK
jgi:hypothetical protein